MFIGLLTGLMIFGLALVATNKTGRFDEPSLVYAKSKARIVGVGMFIIAGCTLLGKLITMFL